MRIFGLTGGIASGKSTVSRMLTELGEHVIDADLLSREVVRPGAPAVDEIRAVFGDAVVREGTVDRAALAAIVFSDEEKRQHLNAIMHPRIGAEFARRTEEITAKGVERVVYEAPLIVENKLHLGMAGLVVVSIPESTQVVRLMRRDGITFAEAQLRLSAQLPLEEKLRAATWVIDNGGTLAATRAQVEELVHTWRRMP